MQWLPLKDFFRNSRSGVATLYEQKQQECQLVTNIAFAKQESSRYVIASESVPLYASIPLSSVSFIGLFYERNR